jgi:hypothetical protein
MAKKKYAYTNFGDILSRAYNDSIRKELLERAKAIQAEKENYWRSYYIQYDNYKLHNRKFGGNSKGITPMEFEKHMDRMLLHEGNEALREQDEIAQRQAEARGETKPLSPENERKKRQAQQAKNDNTQKSDKNSYVSAADFQKLIDELAAKKNIAKQPPSKNNPAPTQGNIDPRRLAFRKQMQEIKERNNKDKGKGLDKE